MSKRVILLGDERKSGVPEAVTRVRDWLRGRAEVVGVDLDGTLDLTYVDADLLVIFGGDGSILSAARRMGDRPIPTIGVNFGKFGFLADIRAREVETGLERVLADQMIVEERLMLRATIGSRELLALNEFFLGPAVVGRITSHELTVNGAYATTYRGDGLLVATPTGSTGHSLSAGGSIVDPKLEAILLTPVNPHSLTNRPLVLPPDVTIHLRALPDHSRGGVSFTADGQVSAPLAVGETVEITRAAQRFPLVRSGVRSNYDVLRSRLNWSGQPPYTNDLGE